MQKKKSPVIYEIPDWYRAATIPKFPAERNRKKEFKSTLDKTKVRMVVPNVKQAL